MVKAEKTTNKKLKAIRSLGKWVAVFALFIFLIFLFAHIALRYGVQISALSESVHQHWVAWGLVRLTLYGIVAAVFYKIYQHVTAETRTAYDKLARAFVICIVIVELINLAQRMGE